MSLLISFSAGSAIRKRKVVFCYTGFVSSYYSCSIRHKSIKPEVKLDLIADHDENYSDVNITQVSFEDCEVPTVPSEIFEKFPGTKDLNLNDQKVKTVVKYSFENASKLETLRLDSNLITELGNKSFWGAVSLRTILLNDNLLGRLEEDTLAHGAKIG